ncbi:MAG: nicotinate-nucleotide adenylyltransferase [Dehalococcoidales bacterium]|nr:nicotinate-nucleotide adenylyltransferase [Dehalococcoidales bacterium]
MNIGVYGGTFDPVHNGHLAVAEEVRSRLKLQEVVFVPAGQPWQKTGRPISPAEHRLHMLRLAIAPCSYFRLSPIEIDKVGLSYAIDPIAELRASLGHGDELFFILGLDSLARLPEWRDVPRLIRMCRLVAVPRPGYSLPDLTALEAALPGLSRRLQVLDRPRVDISASEIRERVASGLPIDHLVPAPVARYIEQYKLYTDKYPVTK